MEGEHVFFVASCGRKQKCREVVDAVVRVPLVRARRSE
jgi:hypothetical protein